MEKNQLSQPILNFFNSFKNFWTFTFLQIFFQNQKLSIDFFWISQKQLFISGKSENGYFQRKIGAQLS